MKINKNWLTVSKPILYALYLFTTLAFVACKDDFLNESPPATLSTSVVLTSPDGFENYLIALHDAARAELSKKDGLGWYVNQLIGTDVACSGATHQPNFRNWETFLNPFTPFVENYWEWAYQDMLLKANTVIVYANKPELDYIWENEEQKNATIAEAKFFRAYTFNFLANTFGSVPIVDTIYSSPKIDFVRSTRESVYDFARQDLEFASQWLPETVPADKEGRIVKAAADHLLSEVYISLERYDQAVESASSVINSGLYKLMDTRFGADADKPGDAFSDLFKAGNQNRSSGNLESIYVWQFEDQTLGGSGNWLIRAWQPWHERIVDPDGKRAMVVSDSIGRGIGWVRPTNYFLYDIWENNWEADIRNSEYNIRRTFYYTNPNSKWFGQKIQPQHIAKQDTFQDIYPIIRKVEGPRVWDAGSSGTKMGWSFKDIMVYRLAETYLLRAEAFFRMGDIQKAAEDINTVRNRAGASPASPAEISIDYILDERARELTAEEPRHRTLVRTGKLLERVRKYNLRRDTRETITEKHQFWPIPQTAIDANIGADLGQNPGY